MSQLFESIGNFFKKIQNSRKSANLIKSNKYDLTDMVLKQSTNINTNINTNIIFSKSSAQEALLYLRYGMSSDRANKVYDKLLDNKDLIWYEDLNKLLTSYSYEINDPDEKDNDNDIIMVGKTKVMIANSLWITKDFVLNENYKRVMLGIGEIKNVANFSHIEKQHILDTWIQENTQNLITHMNISADSAAVVLSAIYFKSKWIVPFKSKNTIEKHFSIDNNKKVIKDFMIMKDQCKLYESWRYQLLCKDYYDGYFLAIAMHTRGYEVPILSHSVLTSLIKQSIKQKVSIEIPRFKIESEHDLKNIIKARLNDEIPFICDQICTKDILEVEQIIQKAVITVDETGTEAAAATKNELQLMSATIVRRPPKQFVANKPFSFYIVKKINNGANIEFIVLFSGILAE